MIRITLLHECELWDMGKRRGNPDLACALVDFGTYEARRMRSPRGEPWLFLTVDDEETMIGAPERWWRLWGDPTLGVDRIAIAEIADATARESVAA